MVRALTPTISRILFAGTIALWSLNDFSASPVLAQSGQFRVPSFNGAATPDSQSPARTTQPTDRLGAISATAQLTSNSKNGLSPHLPSHNSIDLGVNQTGEQDSINDWLTQQDQEPLPGTEELPAGISQSTDNSGAVEVPEGVELSGRSDPVGTGPQDSSNREVIVQRYSDGKPQIERQVIQDEDGNYLNDGYWRVYSQQGQRVILAQGQYHRGVMEGTWMRKHAKNSSGLFATKPFSMFEAPFVSIATFKSSKLDGLWTLLDAANQKMFEVPYQDGKRHGTASWWYPSQTKMREVTFVDGVISGRLREWDEQKKLVRDDEYINGQRLIRNVTYYRPNQIETENYYLDAKLEPDGEDDWWRAEPAPMVSKGSRVQHGPVAFWYENGMPKLKGGYDQGNPVGRFTGWHVNGNKRMEGSFEKGKKEGLWRWWHPNGKKASEGKYKGDQPDGPWIWWNEQGEVEDEKKFDGTNSADEKESPKQISPEDPEQLPDGLFGSATEKKVPDENAKPQQSTDPQSVITLDFEGLSPQQSPEKTEPINPSAEPEKPLDDGQEPSSESGDQDLGDGANGSFDELMKSNGKQK